MLRYVSVALHGRKGAHPPVLRWQWRRFRQNVVVEDAPFGIGDLMLYAGVIAFVVSRIRDGWRRGDTAVDKLVQSKASPMSLPSGIFLGVAALGLFMIWIASPR